MKNRVFLWLAITLLSACSIGFIGDPEPARLKLLPPQEGPGTLLLKQKIMMDFEGQTQFFLAVSRLQVQSIQIIVLTATGQKILSMTYDGERLIMEGDAADKIPGEEILAMMQLSLWPDDSVRRHYQSSMGWALDLSAQRRILNHRSKPMIKVSYQQPIVEIMNYQRNYNVTVETLEKAK